MANGGRKKNPEDSRSEIKENLIVLLLQILQDHFLMLSEDANNLEGKILYPTILVNPTEMKTHVRECSVKNVVPV